MISMADNTTSFLMSELSFPIFTIVRPVGIEPTLNKELVPKTSAST